MGSGSYVIDFKHIRWVSRNDYVRLGILFTYKKSESGERIAVCLVAARSTPTFAAARRLGVPSIVPGVAIGDRVLR